MFHCIVTLTIFVQILQVYPRVIVQHNSEAKLIIYPSKLFLDAFTGRPLNIVCIGEAENGGTFTDFKWLNPQREIIQKGSPGVEQVNEKTLVLTFVDPKTDDSGVYKCTATYGDGDYLETEVSVLFHEDIKFEKCLEHQVLYNNEKGEITCIPVSKKELSITWTKDGKKLEAGRVILTESGISINNVEEEDEGTYVIEVFEPSTGTLKIKNITVEVHDRESGKLIFVSVLNATKDAVFFHIWLGGNAYTIETKYRDSLDETDKIVTWNLGETYVVRNLTPSGQYTFRFRSQPLQPTKWSSKIKITLLPAAPDVILRQMNSEALEVEWVRTAQDTNRNSIDKYQISYQPVQELQNFWRKSSCNITIDISASCSTSTYKMVNLQRKTIYEIRVKAHTSAGYGDAYKQKVRLA